MKDSVLFKNKWVEISKGFGLALKYEIAGYFDERPMIHFCFIYGKFFISLPFKTGIDECEPPCYGFYWYESALWICCGKKIYAFHSPWSWDWHRTSILLKDGVSWENEFKGNRKEFYMDEWLPKVWHEEYPYFYKLKNGEIQERKAFVKVEEREWRRKCFKFIKLFNKVVRSIEINFSDEIGERTGSWKGGCTGCGYELLPNETPLQCLRRMEKERKFL